MGQIDSLGIDTVLMDKHNKIRNTYTIEKQIELTESLLQQSIDEGYLKGQVIAYTNIGYLLRKDFRLKESIEYLMKAESLVEELNENLATGKLYLEFAQVYYRLGLIDTALNYSTKSVKFLATTVPSHYSNRALRSAYRVQALCYRSKDAEKSIILLRQASGIDPTPIVWSNVAYHFIFTNKNVDSAKYYLSEAYKLLEKPLYQYNNFHKGVVLKIDGEFMMEQKQYDKAIESFNEALASTGYNDPPFSVDVYKDLIQAYTLKGDLKAVDSVNQKILALADTITFLKSKALESKMWKMKFKPRLFEPLTPKEKNKLIIASVVFCIGIIGALIIAYNTRRDDPDEQTLPNSGEGDDESILLGRWRSWED